MIKSKVGEVIVKGYLLDVIFECHHLIRALIKDNPEVITAVIYKNSDRLHDVISECDPKKLQIIEEYIDHIEQVRKELNDET